MTLMADGRVEMRCDNCGQTDDHPKLHYGAQTFHHDCLPAYVIDDITSETDWQWDGDARTWVMRSRTSLPELPDHAKRVMHLREKAMNGTRGPKLLSYIEKMDHGQGSAE